MTRAIQRCVLVAAGVLALADQPRPEAKAVIAGLRARGLDVVLLTGDRREVAAAIAAQVGIPAVRAEALPQDKVAAIEALRQQGHRVVMVGDGINDAPALGAADVGIAMGSGTDIAIAAAGCTLLRPDLHGVISALAIARATVRTIRQNLFWAFGYNAAMLPLAAAGHLSPMIASAAMALSSVSVVWNSLRLGRAVGRPGAAIRTAVTAA